MKLIYKKIYPLLVLMAYLCTSIAEGQTNSEWLNYTSGKSINCIKPDGEYIWVGTTGGLVKLNRFTGEAEFFNKSNSPFPTLGSTNPNAIFDIEIDSEGNKWIGLYGGLVKYDGTNWEVYDRFNSGLPYGYVFDIEFDQAGNIWLAVYSGGLAVFDGTDWFVYNTENSDIPYNHLRTIEIDNNGNKWIGGVSIDTLYGITKFDGANFTYYNNLNSGFPNYESARDITFDEDGLLWCATSAGLLTFDGFNWTVYSDTNTALPSQYIDCISFDDEGTAWIGASGGLTKFDGTNWITYTTENSDLPGFSISDIAFADDNNKWIGTSDGLAKFDGTDWVPYQTSNSGLWGNRIYDILFSSSGKIWFATDNGLTGLDGTDPFGSQPGWIDPYISFPEVNHNGSISSIDEDSEGNIWMALGYSGIGKFNGGSWTIYDNDNSSIPSTEYTTVAVDANDKVWIGTRDEGVFKFDGLNWFQYNEQNSGLPEGEITAILIDSLGNKWIATDEGGLARFSGSEWTLFNTSNSPLPDDELTSLAFDPNGGIWVGDWRSNLSFYNGLDWTVYSFQDSGFYSDIISIHIDDEEYKWLGMGSQGIIKFRDDEWEFINTDNSGLSSNQINYITSDKSGNIWIGTGDGGVSIFNKSGITGVETLSFQHPSEFQLHQNYPNPFNPSTVISWQLPVGSHVSLKVFDILGNEVATLVDKYKQAGNYEIEFNAESADGGLSSGVYFYRIQAGSFNQTKKMILLR